MSYCRGPKHPYVICCLADDDEQERKLVYECLGCEIMPEGAWFSNVIHRWHTFRDTFRTDDPLVMYNHLLDHKLYAKRDIPPQYALSRLFREACEGTNELLKGRQ